MFQEIFLPKQSHQLFDVNTPKRQNLNYAVQVVQILLKISCRYKGLDYLSNCVRLYLHDKHPYDVYHVNVSRHFDVSLKFS